MFSLIIRFIQHWKGHGRVAQQLSRLSDRELADIGINRCDIDRIAVGNCAGRPSGDYHHSHSLTAPDDA